MGSTMDRSMDEPSIELARLAHELGHRLEQVQNVVALLDAGNTIPFIMRYRKEKTGNLDEVQLGPSSSESARSASSKSGPPRSCG